MQPRIREHLGPLRRAKWVIGTTQAGVRAIAYAQGRAENVVTRTTDLAIEGFPRSGNSMLKMYISLTNPELQMAHHLHMVGQFAIARKLAVPAVLLVRNPVDAIASLMVADTTLSVEMATRWWVYYHRKLLPYRADVLVLTFDRIIADPQRAVADIATFSGLEISAPTYDQSMRDQVDDALVARGRVARGGFLAKNMPNLVPLPTPEKDALKSRVRASVVARVELERAAEVYTQFRKEELQ